jgi:hypothetical protein
MRVLSFDPGTSNFAFSVQDHFYENTKLRTNIVGTGMFNRCITQLHGRHMHHQIKRFKSAMIKLRDTYKPDLVSIERFQSRGLRGTTIECICIMIGFMLDIFRKQKPYIFLASTWKNRINKKIDLKSSYTKYGLQLKASPKTPHELDATLIGFYVATRYFGMSDFANFSETNWEKFIKYFLSTAKL